MSNQSGFDIYKALIKPLRDNDGNGNNDGTGMLQRYMGGPQATHDAAEAAILTLLTQFNPSLTYTQVLPYLKDIVGFTNELRSITDRLSTLQLRRLIGVAVPLWKERFTTTGLISTIRLLTGRDAFVTNWFGYRNILGEATMSCDMLPSGGDYWAIGGSSTVYDEYWSNIKLMDDGTLDPILLLDVCQLQRPMSERFEIMLDDFLDYFQGDLSKWQAPGSGTVADNGSINTTEYTYPTLELTGELEPIVPIIASTSDFHDYNITCKFLLTTGASFKTRWYADSATDGDAYELTISKQSVELVRYNSGTPTTLVAAFNPATVNILENTWYQLRIGTVNGSGVNQLRVLLDECLIIPTSGVQYADTTTGPTYGSYMFWAPTDDAPVHLDNVESWRNPARFATIEVSTLAEPGGAITMTSNFVL